MHLTATTEYNWKQFHSFTSFEKFLQTFVIDKQSLVTTHKVSIDPSSALTDINKRFIEDFDDGNKSFDEKARIQFDEASLNTRIFFAHIEYLWAMPTNGISPTTKRGYILRFFDSKEVIDAANLFFDHPHGVAKPGQYYNTNKYYELRAIIDILTELFKIDGLNSVKQVKDVIEKISYSRLWKSLNAEGKNKDKYCGVYAFLLHLCNPDKYESIISKKHRTLILGVFSHILPEINELVCPEMKLKYIREKLYEEHGANTGSDRKYRWFFYCDDVRSIWYSPSSNPSKSFMRKASIQDQLRREDSAHELKGKEGEKIKTESYRIYRNSKLVNERKRHDKYTCQGCKFFFEKQIVHVHHLDPLSERVKPRETVMEDLITLCPNCHYIAHYLLRKKKVGYKFKQRQILIDALKTTINFS